MKGPKDPNQLAYDTVAKLTGRPTIAETERGKKGADARNEALTPEERSGAAKKAVESRWLKDN